MAEIILNDNNFESEVLSSSVPVLVDFWASWCGPCQKMGPILEQIASEMDSSKLKVAKLNVEESSISGNYQVMSIPTFIIFKDGAELTRTEGAQSKESLEEFIKNALS